MSATSKTEPAGTNKIRVLIADDHVTVLEGLAAIIGRQIFGVAFHVDLSWLVFLSVAAIMLAVATVATSIAASRIWGIDPAVILRGE